MTLWFVFALMTAAAILAVLWPLSRRGPEAGGSDVAVYRDQLDEITRDRSAGLIGEAEAEAAKVEVSRRLIAAADASDKAMSATSATSATPLWRRRAAALAGLLLLPIGATVLYLAIGSPLLPGEPLASRVASVQADAPIANLVAQAEAHLERNPNDARGYEVLAPVYLRLGRFGDAVIARRKLLAISGETAARQADLGEALMAAGNGIVTAESKAAFERAVELDPSDIKARFFIGVAAEQDGARDKAAAIWSAMLVNAPADAPWADIVRQSIARVGGTSPVSPVAAAPGPSKEDVAAASGMSETDRDEMVRGMVARLADRLKQNGDDIDGWQRLLRAYIVLGDRDKAVSAAGEARRAFSNDPDKLRRIDDAIKSMGIEG